MQQDSSLAVTEITSLIQAREEAIRNRDTERLVAQCAPDFVAFDALPPLSWRGSHALREKLAGWFGGYDGPVGYAIQDLQVTASDNVGFAHYLYHVTGALKNGNPVDMWVRATACLVKQDGEWRITHEHTSAPFDPESGKALVSLQPE